MDKLCLWPGNVSYMSQCLESYGCLDVNDKTVIDIGADWGNSVVFWWLRGAKKIIAYESNPNCFTALKSLAKRGVPLDFRGPWHREYPDGDVLKIDCEGCESDFYSGNLANYAQWAFALHESTFDKRGAIIEMGGRLHHAQAGEEVWVKT